MWFKEATSHAVLVMLLMHAIFKVNERTRQRIVVRKLISMGGLSNGMTALKRIHQDSTLERLSVLNPNALRMLSEG
jgi:hypothetical protein